MEPRRYAYIDALRGYAILMVVMVHTSGAFPDLPQSLAKVLSQGARGVQLFFVTSALTLAMSCASRNEAPADFYARRLFRIAPMFWLAIPFFLWLNGTGPSLYAPAGIGIRHILMTTTFLHGLWPDTIDSIVPGGWSIADEVIFYAIFPMLAPALIKESWRSVIIATVAAIVLGAPLAKLTSGLLDLMTASDPNLSGVYFFLWFPRQLPCFLMGIILFKLTADRISISERTAKSVCWLSIVLMPTMAFLSDVKYAMPFGAAATYGLIFSLFTFSLMHLSWSPLVGRPIVWIGKVSYSAYFVHFAVLHFLPTIRLTGAPSADLAIMFAGVTLATIGVSSITYLMIEKPMIKLGNALVSARQVPTEAVRHAQA
jgi:peptidoglycan/LPS O-acetylase OafA/YrhL